MQLLNMNNNQITNIPNEIENLQEKLLELYINNNLLTELPKTINKLKNLCILDVSYNRLWSNSFEILFPLEKIEQINFAHNIVDTISSNFYYLIDTLQYLNLSYNNISDISNIVNTLNTTLKELYLRHNQLEKIPNAIANKLQTLTVLDLGKNLLDANDIDILYLNSLTHLYLDHNLISYLPKVFEYFAKNNTLKVLDMSYNMLSDVGKISNLCSLEEVYLANNQISKMLPLYNLQQLKILDLWFNTLHWTIKEIIEKLTTIHTSLEQFSFRHNQLRGIINSDIMNLQNIGLWTCQLDYNILDVQAHELTDPELTKYLNQHCLTSTHTEEYLNTDWKKQYTLIDTRIEVDLDTAWTIRWWDEIEITVTMSNEWNKNTDILDLFVYDNPTAFTIVTPTDGYAMQEDANFDTTDPCREHLASNITWPYAEELKKRANKNWWSTFWKYLVSNYRDYDLYALWSFTPYSDWRGNDFLHWIDQYTYDAFDATFQWWLFSWLFDIDLNDLAIQWCGLNGKNVTMYDHTAFNKWEIRDVSYTLKIADDFEGAFDISFWLKSDNRLYQETNTKDNRETLSVSVKWPAIDTDGDGIYDEDDNCPLVRNPWQEDSYILSWKTWLLTIETEIENPNKKIGNDDPTTKTITLTDQDWNMVNKQDKRQLLDVISPTWWIWSEDDFDLTDTEWAMWLCNDPWLLFRSFDDEWSQEDSKAEEDKQAKEKEFTQVKKIGDGEALAAIEILQINPGEKWDAMKKWKTPRDPIEKATKTETRDTTKTKKDTNEESICLHTLLDDRYYDISIDDWIEDHIKKTIYTITEYIRAIGDACDCNDNICTEGNDVFGKLICDPVDPACTIPSLCWNGTIEWNEQCDGNNFNGQTCANFGYSLWSLMCNDDCKIITTNCHNPSWGGWWWSSLVRDNCPDGDYSPSYYDGSCWTAPTNNHAAAPISPPLTTTTPLTRKALAQLVSVAAKEILQISPDLTMPCRFWDISPLSSSYQNAILLSCQHNLMGLHKNGIDVKIDFEPNKIVDYNEAATVLSRLLYDGKFNPARTSLTLRYQPHVTQIQKVWLLSKWTKITQELIINILHRIQQNPSYIQRTPWTHTAAPQKWTNNVITAPATAISDPIKTFLKNFNIFIKKITHSENTSTGAHESAWQQDITKDSSDVDLLKDLSKFLP